MRHLLAATMSLLAMLSSTSSASAFWLHHGCHHCRVPVSGVPVIPAGASAQALPPGLVAGLIGSIPGLLGNLSGQTGFQFPFNPNQQGQQGQLLPSTPVPNDVATRLNDVDKKLDDIKKRSEALLPKPTVVPGP